MKVGHRLAAALAWKFDPLRPPLSWRDAERLQRLYGMTKHDFYALLSAQRGVCAICSSAPKKNRLLYVDHHHSTGQVRGLLCSNCNSGLGMFCDDAELVRSACAYLNGI